MVDQKNEKVVVLDRFRQNNASTVQTPDMALTPSVYRAVSENGKVMYSFMPDVDDPRLKNARWELIEYLDPAIDTGWLMIRYHNDQSMGVAILKDRGDTGLEDDAVLSTMLLTQDAGCFILTHREAVEGAPEHLIIYVNENPDAESLEPEKRAYVDCLYFIVHPDGQITYDPTILYPE